MADIVSPKKRSEMMSGIKGKDTQPELLIRKALHRRGFRFRLHDKKLPGKPDIVFPKYKAVLFIHGCFWHGHNCHLFKWPSTRKEFWNNKIHTNQALDAKNIDQLLTIGWRVGVIWECSTKGKTKQNLQYIIDSSSNWLVSNEKKFEIYGHL